MAHADAGGGITFFTQPEIHYEDAAYQMTEGWTKEPVWIEPAEQHDMIDQ